MKGFVFFLACLLLGAAGASAAIVPAQGMSECERKCVELHGPPIEMSAKDPGATYAERRSRVFQGSEQLNACLQACAAGGSAVTPAPEPVEAVVEEESQEESGPPAHAPARGRGR
ncbi:hypothetical protein [Geoalkalibacter halelectricus]|uniref:Uncharacterized protein n=1 Tax=Geoalkalibacter halelectricus TaxID=2847045 RepID=A0ABY5ZNA3_9BACT|nr:hypothetical protein [Geoalkalibacter halelectricus]MDO3378713.1 hypothetical protein [Geoalkalibacter halelectricus]UWZ79979.1 hypothetical protein L9S41_00935 [Geoalkalibacter halelectricus]